MNKTIKQLADELRVSKTAVRNYMDDEFRAKYTAKNDKEVITINPDGCKVIAEKITKQAETNRNTFAESEIITIPRSVLDTLQNQLAQKDEQIKALNEALKEAQKLTSQEQHLHLNKLMALEAPKKRWGWLGKRKMSHNPDTRKENEQ